MSRARELEKLASKAADRGLSTDGNPGAGRHIVLCTGDKCCEGNEGERAWKQLKQRASELKESGASRLLRSRTSCLQMCAAGPIAVVYPDGTWYHSVSADVLVRIIDEHAIFGKVVRSHCFAHDPLVG